jgi:hypothetical protein
MKGCNPLSENLTHTTMTALSMSAMPPMQFTEEELRGLLSSPNSTTVGMAIVDSASHGRKIVIAMLDGATMRLSTTDRVEAVLHRLFAWPAPDARAA